MIFILFKIIYKKKSKNDIDREHRFDFDKRYKISDSNMKHR